MSPILQLHLPHQEQGSWRKSIGDFIVIICTLRIHVWLVKIALGYMGMAGDNAALTQPRNGAVIFAYSQLVELVIDTLVTLRSEQAGSAEHRAAAMCAHIGIQCSGGGRITAFSSRNP